IIVLAYMIVSRPAGALVVTYERRTPQTLGSVSTASDGASDSPGRPTAGERLRELDALRREGLITDEEFAERRRSIVEDL
ncbi:MAG: SHOCT domain-containing protein, partial [Actinomycetota bacterium]|nr:SHOCT domain-containing protein [Actinomycetota bacterium]